MANVELTGEVSKQDTQRLIRAMDKLQSQLGHTPAEAVKMGAFAVARALAAATKTSPKRRKVKAVSDLTDKRKAKFVALRPSTNGDIEIPIRSDSIEEARNSKNAQIKRSGLAKASWLWAGKKASNGSLGGKDVKGAASAVNIRKQLKGSDPYIEINNRLDYVTNAFKSKGRATIDTAMERAANGMIKYLERKTGKTIQQLGLS